MYQPKVYVCATFCGHDLVRKNLYKTTDFSKPFGPFHPIHFSIVQKSYVEIEIGNLSRRATCHFKCLPEFIFLFKISNILKLSFFSIRRFLFVSFAPISTEFTLINQSVSNVLERKSYIMYHPCFYAEIFESTIPYIPLSL